MLRSEKRTSQTLCIRQATQPRYDYPVTSPCYEYPNEAVLQQAPASRWMKAPYESNAEYYNCRRQKWYPDSTVILPATLIRDVLIRTLIKSTASKQWCSNYGDTLSLSQLARLSGNCSVTSREELRGSGRSPDLFALVTSKQ